MLTLSFLIWRSVLVIKATLNQTHLKLKSKGSGRGHLQPVTQRKELR